MPRIKLLSPAGPITLQVGQENVTFENGIPVDVATTLYAELMARNPTDKSIDEAMASGDQVWADEDEEDEEGGEG